MPKNHFLPVGLPVLADGVLIRTLVDYRHTYETLARSTAWYAEHIREQVEEAIGVIEQELENRGLGQYAETRSAADFA